MYTSLKTKKNDKNRIIFKGLAQLGYFSTTHMNEKARY